MQGSLGSTEAVSSRAGLSGHDSFRALHFIGICGKAMGGIAAALAREGWRITGSDENVYEPMSGHLQECGVRIISPYDPSNVPDDADMVIVGKRIAAGNSELLHVIRRGIPHRSFPQFLHDHFLKRSRNAVVAGGVGKTTTTAMLAWILEHAGLNPDYLCGGLAKNLKWPARFSGSAFSVLEGDEYASCFDDRNPKFLHYRPEVVAITNIVEDHPDMYESFDDLCDAFAALVEMIPARGRLILPDDDGAAARVANAAKCDVVTVGFGSGAGRSITDVQASRDGTRFSFMGENFQLSQCGLMNVRNAAMAAQAAENFGVTPSQSAAALRSFRGVTGRQEESLQGNCTLVRDKASHPRALGELLRAMRQRFPGRRLISIVRPRATGGGRWIYQRDLPDAIAGFDRVIVCGAYEHNPQGTTPWADLPFCNELFITELARRSVPVSFVSGVHEMSDAIRREICDGDVAVVTVPEQSLDLIAAVERALVDRVEDGSDGAREVISARASV